MAKKTEKNPKGAGRDSVYAEMEIAKCYAQLQPVFFEIIERFAKSKKKTDQKWAAEQMSKGFVKMLPQTLAGDPEKPLNLQITGMKIIYEGENGNRIPDKKPETAPGQ